MSANWACLIARPGLLWVAVGWFDRPADQMQLDQIEQFQQVVLQCALSWLNDKIDLACVIVQLV